MDDMSTPEPRPVREVLPGTHVTLDGEDVTEQITATARRSGDFQSVEVQTPITMMAGQTLTISNPEGEAVVHEAFTSGGGYLRQSVTWSCPDGDGLGSQSNPIRFDGMPRLDLDESITGTARRALRW